MSISQNDIKKLFSLSAGMCNICRLQLAEHDVLIGEMAHIIAKSPNGPRGNNYSPQINSYNNLILLCPNHHTETNDTEKYTVDSLREMKQRHESLSISKELTRNPSMLKNAINAISTLSLEDIIESEGLNVYNPKLKLNYNSVKTNYSLIQDYKVYQGKINSLYDELERQGSIKKEKLLSNINQIYAKIKGGYVLDSENPLEIIRLNADKILDDVFDELYEKLENSNFFDEDIIIGVRLILVDAFIRCKILEEPIEDDNK